MMRTLIVVAFVAASANAAPRHHHRRAPRNLIASMNLTPRRDLARTVSGRAFTPDRLPTNVVYAPNSRLGATVGYKPISRGQDLQPYEVNQAAATRFGSPDPAVGASVAVKF